MLKHAYNLVMDDNRNAFSALPRATKFQFMITLAYMWCALFSVGMGSFVYFGTSVVLHVLVIVGLFYTADSFSKAREKKITHRQAFRDKDGGARYDDMWGSA